MPLPDSALGSSTSAAQTRTRKRSKLDPDAGIRLKLLAVASKIVKECGVSELTIANLLRRAKLGTRAFYRHFDSKDQLVQEVFLDMGRVEMLRLRRKMASAAGPLDAVAAWIEGRLDLVFDDAIRSDLRQLSMEAQSQMFATPELVNPAYREMLKPLVEQLTLGGQQGIFRDLDPETDSEMLQGAVWACLERQWSTGGGDRQKVYGSTLRFCLSGLGVPHEQIAAVIAPMSANTSSKKRK